MPRQARELSGTGIYHVMMRGISWRVLKKQFFKSFILFISLMQEKRNQRVHYPQGPLDRGMQTENCRNRQFSVGFGKPGRRLVLFYRQAHKS